jgi:hypothetical protein
MDYVKKWHKSFKKKAYLIYSDQKFVNTSIVFLYKQKSFIVNLTTNNLNDLASRGLMERIEFK